MIATSFLSMRVMFGLPCLINKIKLHITWLWRNQVAYLPCINLSYLSYMEHVFIYAHSSFFSLFLFRCARVWDVIYVDNMDFFRFPFFSHNQVSLKAIITSRAWLCRLNASFRYNSVFILIWKHQFLFIYVSLGSVIANSSLCLQISYFNEWLLWWRLLLASLCI